LWATLTEGGEPATILVAGFAVTVIHDSSRRRLAGESTSPRAIAASSSATPFEDALSLTSAKNRLAPRLRASGGEPEVILLTVAGVHEA
jgi:hypothetical protein